MTASMHVTLASPTKHTHLMRNNVFNAKMYRKRKLLALVLQVGDEVGRRHLCRIKKTT